jgi:hypothetical protein
MIYQVACFDTKNRVRAAYVHASSLDDACERMGEHRRCKRVMGAGIAPRYIRVWYVVLVAVAWTAAAAAAVAVVMMLTVMGLYLYNLLAL